MKIHIKQQNITEERICKCCKKKYLAYKEPYKVKRSHRYIRWFSSVACSSECSKELKNHGYDYKMKGGVERDGR